MSDESKPWAEPGLSAEERAGRMFDRLGVAMDPSNPGSDWQEIEAEIADALRAARADALEEAAVLLDAKGQGMAGHDVRALKDRP